MLVLLYFLLKIFKNIELKKELKQLKKQLYILEQEGKAQDS